MSSHTNKSNRLHSHDPNGKKNNNQSSENYPTFHVRSRDYDIIFVNNNTSTDVMKKLLIHVNVCKQYSIDTESDRRNNRLSLIQINSIPVEPKSIVMLFELNHFPYRNSQKYDNIYQIFRLIFRADNEIYSWGNMQVELERTKDLFIWPIPATLIDIQPHFPGWYNWARTQCRVQDLSCNEITQQHHQTLSCSCHPPSPYKINELWSLQKAFGYGCKLFIDKSCTLGKWSSSLSSSHSSLSHEDQVKMINYATHDAMAVTFLIRPITEKWTFKKIEERNMSEMFNAFNSIKLPPLSTTTSTKKKLKNINVQKLSKIFKCLGSDIESISSDDEIYLNQLAEPVKETKTQDVKPVDDDLEPISEDEIHHSQLIEPITNTKTEDVEQMDDDYIPVNDDLLNDNKLIVNNHDMVDDANDEEEPTPTEKRTKNQQRSLQARKRRNHLRNTALKKQRYYYSIKRKWYPRFPMLMIRKILRLYNIEYKHVRDDGEELLIGLKDRRSRNTAQHQLPANIFSKRSYFHYRKVFRR
jgi:hypothetical protein